MSSRPEDSPRLPEDAAVVFFDFDGTVLPAGGQISEADKQALRRLGDRGVIRVVATGRGLRSLRRDCPEDLPFDHLVFSSGLGLCPWTASGPGPLLRSRRFADGDNARALAACLEIKRGFFAFEPPPDDHFHLFHDPEGYRPTEGYLARLDSYREFASRYAPGRDPGPRSEFLIPAPAEDMPAVRARFEELCPGLSCLVSSSPFGDRSMWLEILPPGVDKGSAAAELAGILNVPAGRAVALGNDFNDLELLEWAGSSFVTLNGAPELRERFQAAPAATDSPLAWLEARLAEKAAAKASGRNPGQSPG